MTLKVKTFLILLATTVCLLAVLTTATRLVLSRSFGDLEDRRQVERAEALCGDLHFALSQLENASAVWCSWAASRRHWTADPEIPSHPLAGAAEADVDWVVIVDSTGRPVFERLCRPATDADAALPASLRDMARALTTGQPYRQDRMARSGLHAKEDRVSLVTVQPLRRAFPGTGSRATLLAGQYLTGDILTRLNARVGSAIHVRRITPIEVPMDISYAAHFGNMEVPMQLDVLGPRQHRVTIYLPDISGSSRLKLEFLAPRDITRRGGAAALAFTVILVACCAAFAVAVLLLLHSQVLRRTSELGRTMSTIGRTGDLSRRVPVDGLDEIARLGAVINDMLEQLELFERQLVQAEKMASLGVLVAGVAHEINNPNQFIMTHLTPLRRAWTAAVPILDRYLEENGDFRLGGALYSRRREQIPEMLDAVESGAQRIKTIVRELRDYARETPSGNRRPMQLNDAIRSALSLLASPLKKSTTALELDLPDDLPEVQGNYQRLEQVLINLIQNACQALAEPSQGLRIRSSATPEGGVAVEITDDGVGIRPEDLSRITDPFFTTRREKGGTGLGLSISNRIVAEHGGTLSFNSTPGVGTTARMVLPAMENEAAGDTEQSVDTTTGTVP